MKKTLFILALIASGCFADDITFDENLLMRLKTPDGRMIVTGSLEDTLANYPSQKTAISKTITDYLSTQSQDLKADPILIKRLSDLSSAKGVSVSKDIADQISKMPPLPKVIGDFKP